MLQLGWTLKTLCKEKNPDTKDHKVYNSLYMKYPRKGKSMETVDSQEQSWKYYTSWFQAILQSYINQKIWYWHKNRHAEQWIRIESLKINPHIFRQLTYNKGAKNILWRQDNPFNKQCWEKSKATCKRMQLDHYHTPHTINSKWIKGLNIRRETTKLPDKNMRGNHIDTGYSNVLGALTPQNKSKN